MSAVKRKKTKKLKEVWVPKWEPDAVFVGSLRRGRVCYDHRGIKLKVMSVGAGSVSIRYAGGTNVSINGKSFVSPNKPVCVSRETVVFTDKRKVRA